MIDSLQTLDRMHLDLVHGGEGNLGEEIVKGCVTNGVAGAVAGAVVAGIPSAGVGLVPGVVGGGAAGCVTGAVEPVVSRAWDAVKNADWNPF